MNADRKVKCHRKTYYEAPTPLLPIATAATSDSVFVDGSSVAHGPSLACDDDTISWFGSNANGNSSSLVLDIGAAGPFYDELLNMTVSNRWAAVQFRP